MNMYMNKTIITISTIIGSGIGLSISKYIYQRKNTELEHENMRLTILIERLKYENDKMDKLLKQKIFDILKYNMCIKKPKTIDDKILIKYDSPDSDSDPGSDSDSDSDSNLELNGFQDYDQINELSESLNSELESLNSDDSSKSKIDPSLSNLV